MEQFKAELERLLAKSNEELETEYVCGFLTTPADKDDKDKAFFSSVVSGSERVIQSHMLNTMQAGLAIMGVEQMRQVLKTAENLAGIAREVPPLAEGELAATQSARNTLEQMHERISGLLGMPMDRLARRQFLAYVVVEDPLKTDFMAVHAAIACTIPTAVRGLSDFRKTVMEQVGLSSLGQSLGLSPDPSLVEILDRLKDAQESTVIGELFPGDVKPN